MSGIVDFGNRADFPGRERLALGSISGEVDGTIVPLPHYRLRRAGWQRLPTRCGRTRRGTVAS